MNWLTSQYGDRVVRAELHLDEITPHIHAYLVPLDEKGKLNCWGLFGTKQKLSALQDSYAAALSPLGIDRGIKGSRATYTNIQKFYGYVNQRVPELLCFRQLAEPQEAENAINYKQRLEKEWQPTVNWIEAQLSERALAKKQKLEAQKTALESERQRQKLEQQIQELVAQNQFLKAQVNALQDYAGVQAQQIMASQPDPQQQPRSLGKKHKQSGLDLEL